MLYKFCNFSLIFSFFMLIQPFQEKSHFRLYLKSSKQWILELCKLYIINRFKPIWTYFRNRLVPNDIFFYLAFFLIFQQLSTNTVLRKKFLVLLHAQQTYINFLCLLSTINYWPVSIDINVELWNINVTCCNRHLYIVGPYCIYKVVLVRKPLIM